MKQLLVIALLVSIVLNSCGNMVSESSLKASEIDAATIIKLINSGKPVALEGKTITGDIDFTCLKNQSSENGKTIRMYIDQPLSFVNCTFTGKIICSGFDNEKMYRRCTFAKNLIFTSCVFKEEVSFKESDVRGIADFSHSVFEKKADFSSIYFDCNNSYFNETSFNGDVLFNDSRFAGNVTFFKSFFKATTLFQNTWFTGNVNFASVICNAYTDFSNASFMGIVNMNYLKSSAKLLLNSVRFMGRFDAMQVNIEGLWEVKNSVFFGQTRLTEATCQGKVHFENISFYYLNNDFTKMKKAAGTEVFIQNISPESLKIIFEETSENN